MVSAWVTRGWLTSATRTPTAAANKTRFANRADVYRRCFIRTSSQIYSLRIRSNVGSGAHWSARSLAAPPQSECRQAGPQQNERCRFRHRGCGRVEGHVVDAKLKWRQVVRLGKAQPQR